MKALILYDSLHGNTEKIAQAIGETIGCRWLRAGEWYPDEVKRFDFVMIGSPTHGGFYSKAMDGLIISLPVLEGIYVAAFDTRTKINIFGYAAPKIAKKLKEQGGNLLAPPEGFFVLGTQGPLKAGEIERAVDWAKTIAGQFKEQPND